MRYATEYSRHPYPDGQLVQLEHTRIVDHVHVFTDDDLGRDGHITLDSWLNPHVVNPTHVAIPVEQYVRIFGEL